MSKRKTTSQYIQELNLVFPNLKLLTPYESNKRKIIVEDEYGIKYQSCPIDLLVGHKPTIRTAVDPTDYFIKKSELIHGKKYDYSKSIYLGKNKKIKIICKIHGEFDQLPGDHMNGGHGCQKCALSSGAWRLSDWKKKSEVSNTLENHKLYCLKISDNKESFLKIGITFRSIESRIKGIPKNYSIEILDYIVDSPENIYKVEKYLKRQLKKYRYKPKTSFCGQTECFENSALEKINQFLNIV